MKQVWKYCIDPNNLTHIMPKGAKILCVDEQMGNICIWVEVNPSHPHQERRIFEVFGTGHPIIEDMGTSREYIGSVKMDGGQLVFHVYEYTGI